MSSTSADGIRELKKMASDHKISQILVKDDVCIGSLVMILSNSDLSFVQLALETIQSLAKWSDLRGFLKEFLGMEDQLIYLMKFSCPPLKKLAYHVHDMLYGDSVLDESFCNVGLAQLRPSSRKRRDSFFVNAAKKAKTVTFLIQGLDSKEDVDICRNSLLQVKGIISITFDLRKRRTTLRTKPELSPQVVAQTIADTTKMSAQQLIKNWDGTETLVSFESCIVDSNLMPGYPRLDESMVIGDQNVVPCFKRFSGGPSWSFLQTVGNFLSNSFYW